MLLSLTIENFAIVKRLELEFREGLTAFTGETGAGKSIMIDALMLALGERADASVIRYGEEKCEIQATFDIAPHSPAARWLKEHDVIQDDSLILRRMLSTEGRSKSYINGVAFPLAKVKELSSLLVDIHGQHQHQTLLHPNTHRIQLDEFADNEALLQNVSHHFKTMQQLQAEIKQLKAEELGEAKQQLLAFQIEELRALAAQPNEMTLLSEEHHELYHAKSYLEKSHTIITLLNEETKMSIRAQLHQIEHLLMELKTDHQTVIRCTELIQAAIIHTDEALDEINEYSHHLTLDPEQLHRVESRMSALHQTARKYQIDPNQLSLHLEMLEQTLAHLDSHDEILAHKERQYREAEQAYHDAAMSLRQARQTAAPILSLKITSIIQELGMPKGQFSIRTTPLESPSRQGIDKIEYWVCTNPGMQPAPLSKIASGGELSRISLAIQMVTAQKGLTPTLLFDEVDVGIGGSTAALVGQHLRALAQRLQIFCVTHQPQVAACANQHYKVIKEAEGEQTFSAIIPLKQDQQIDEIARMLGGLNITEKTRHHALEMITESTV